MPLVPEMPACLHALGSEQTGEKNGVSSGAGDWDMGGDFKTGNPWVVSLYSK